MGMSDPTANITFGAGHVFTFNGNLNWNGAGFVVFNGGVNFGGMINVHVDSNNVFNMGISNAAVATLTGNSNLGWQTLAGTLDQAGFDLTGTFINVSGSLTQNGGDLTTTDLNVLSAGLYTGGSGQATLSGDFTVAASGKLVKNRLQNE